MEDLKKLIGEILTKGKAMSLATVDDGGVWVADVRYVADEDFNIYWMSAPDTRHSLAIEKEPQVAGTITLTDEKGEKNEGLQFSGLAERMEGLHPALLAKAALKNNRPIPIDAVKALAGRSWYVLRPKMIEVIYEPLFGFEKQGYDLMNSDG